MTNPTRDPVVLAIDSGTQSTRALAFDLKGNLVAKVKIDQEPYQSPKPGWAEQDPEYYWDNLCRACRGLLQEVVADSIQALALTTQRNTVVCLDDRDEPLRPAIVWLDQRRTKVKKSVGVLWNTAFSLVGMKSSLAYFMSESEANWLEVNEPDVWKRTRKFLFLSGFLLHRLTGSFVDSIGSQVGFVPFDYKNLTWARPHDWKWKALPLRRDMLPDLAQPTEILGEITGRAAEQTGLPKGLPVVAAAADKACEVLGAGCLSPNKACLSYGTTATVNTTHHKYVEAVPFIPPYPAAIPGAYSLEVQIYRGYWLVSWFKRQFGLREVEIAEKRGISPEQLFDEMIRDIPAGAMGLMLQPFWSPGVKVPGPEAKGAVIGFGDVHTRAHLYRAILEGLAYGLREGLERCEKRSRVPVESLMVAGGGSQSDQAMQITADLFARPAARPHVYEASGLGAAMDAAVGMGLHPDIETAVSDMSRTGRVFEPRPEVSRRYDALYHRVYRRLYKRLRPLYEEIQAITGYPEPW